MDIERGPGLAESRKSTKKSWETGKIQKMWPEPPGKCHFWSHEKLKKNLRKAGKSILFLWKAGNRPPIPDPLETLN